MGAGFAEQINETMTIQDCILGTAASTCRIRWANHAVLRPYDDAGVIDTLFCGISNGSSVGYHHPVTIYSSSVTELSACKRMWITQDGLSAHPSIACAAAHIEVQDIQHCKDRQMIERMAWRRAGKQQSEAEAIASSHAEQRLNERVNEQAVEPLDGPTGSMSTSFSVPSANGSCSRKCCGSPAPTRPSRWSACMPAAPGSRPQTARRRSATAI